MAREEQSSYLGANSSRTNALFKNRLRMIHEPWPGSGPAPQNLQDGQRTEELSSAFDMIYRKFL